MIVVKHRGNFNKTEKFLRQATKLNYRQILEKYGQRGVDALASATPIDSGLTASSWGYEIHSSGSSFSISWTNSNVVDGVPIAIILQYGHATGSGGFVQGRDYINPAIQPIFDQLATEAWKEVTKA
jgi:hypothetical protein